eukprot:m51a1_g2010 hypothetical protein (1665) ;mRNA; f:1254071-1259731
MASVAGYLPGHTWSELVGGPSLPIVVDSLALCRLARSPSNTCAQPLRDLWAAERLLRSLSARGLTVVLADLTPLLRGSHSLSPPRALCHDVVAAHVRRLGGCAAVEPVRSLEQWRSLLGARGPDSVVMDLGGTRGCGAYGAAVAEAAARASGLTRLLHAELEVCGERVFGVNPRRCWVSSAPKPSGAGPRCLPQGALDAVARAVARSVQFPAAPGGCERLVASAAVVAAAAWAKLPEEEARALVLAHCVALAVPVTRRALRSGPAQRWLPSVGRCVQALQAALSSLLAQEDELLEPGASAGVRWSWQRLGDVVECRLLSAVLGARARGAAFENAAPAEFFPPPSRCEWSEYCQQLWRVACACRSSLRLPWPAGAAPRAAGMCAPASAPQRLLPRFDNSFIAKAAEGLDLLRDAGTSAGLQQEHDSAVFVPHHYHSSTALYEVEEKPTRSRVTLRVLSFTRTETLVRMQDAGYFEGVQLSVSSFEGEQAPGHLRIKLIGYRPKHCLAHAQATVRVPQLQYKGPVTLKSLEAGAVVASMFVLVRVSSPQREQQKWVTFLNLFAESLSLRQPCIRNAVMAQSDWRNLELFSTPMRAAATPQKAPKPGAKGCRRKVDVIRERIAADKSLKEVKLLDDHVEWTAELPWSERITVLCAKSERFESAAGRAHCCAQVASLCLDEWASLVNAAVASNAEPSSTTPLEYALRLAVDAFRLYSEALCCEDAVALVRGLCHLGLREIAHQLCCQYEHERRSADPQACDKLLNALQRARPRTMRIRHAQEFQMACMGPIMHRCYGSRPDPRLDSFAPDDWQRRVLDAIDAHQSALVVAATSLGKTAVCFHTVEKLLQDVAQSGGGVGSKIVVYVAPTKALANQAAAEFSSRKCAQRNPSVGIFTRDYRINEDCCDVLVTVPQVLEMLLLSNRTFAQRLFYTVIDEVHCIHSSPQATGDIEQGSAWENVIKLCPCPFLALSATIGNPREFHAWLDGIEERKAGRHVEFIHFDKRFTDQEFFVFDAEAARLHPQHPLPSTLREVSGPGALRHMHPLGTLAQLSDGPEMQRAVQQLSLTPAECAQTFDAVQRLCKSGELEGELAARVASEMDPGAWFPRWQVITRDAVYEYEQRLKSFLCDVAARTTEAYVHMMESIIHEEERGFTCGHDPEHTLVGKISPNSEKLCHEFLDRARLRAGERELRLLDLAWKYGIGVHHSDLSRHFRNCIEVLFRAGRVQVVFATSTLALGINMPIKTVVFLADSPFLSPLLFRQMCGRAGRRTYDNVGKIVFVGFSPQRSEGLMLSKLPDLTGQLSFTASHSLRLLVASHIYRNYFGASEEEVWGELGITKYLSLMAHSSTTPEQVHLQERLLFLFSLEFLLSRGFLDGQGRPIGMTGVVSHLHYHQPANLIFCHLVSTGHIQRLCGRFRKDSKKTVLSLLELLCHLFNVIPLPHGFKPGSVPPGSNSLVVLPPLAGDSGRALDEYSRGVIDVFTHCSAALCTRVPVECDVRSLTLPVSGESYALSPEQLQNAAGLPFVDEREVIHPVVRSPFAALSGLADTFGSGHELCDTAREAAQFDGAFLPLAERTNARLKGLKVNSYALDFFKHGIVREISEVNGVAGAWSLLMDWSLLLKALKVVLSKQLEVGAPCIDGTTVEAFDCLSSQFAGQFDLAKSIQ